MDLKIRLVKDFFWLIVTQNVGKIYGKYELYELHSDGSESLINSFGDCYRAIKKGNEIGIELGKFSTFSKKILDVDGTIIKHLNEGNYEYI
jgi:hypothetical protein